jgi:hypothetical protein
MGQKPILPDMANTPKFGCPELTQKMLEKFGDQAETIVVDMKYSLEIDAFLEMLQQAREDAAHSTLVFK